MHQEIPFSLSFWDTRRIVEPPIVRSQRPRFREYLMENRSVFLRRCSNDSTVAVACVFGATRAKLRGQLYARKALGH